MLSANDFGMAVVQSGAGKTETVLDFVCDVRLLQNTQDSYVLRAYFSVSATDSRSQMLSRHRFWHGAR